MANSILKQTTLPIKDDLKLFQKEFEAALESDVKIITTVAKYIIKRRGKRFRPILTLLSAHLCGKPTKNTYRAAAVMELLHIATLIHDDIVDDAEYRRGFPAINRVWKNKVALLMGDYVLSKSLIYMIKMRDFKVLDSIGATAEDLSSGELLQIEKSRKNRMDEDVYYKMIGKKTASLIASSCELGAITASENEKDHKTLKLFGENLGMAFQIKDDLFDLLGSESETGKDLAADVISNMITLPVIYSLKTADSSTVRQINKLLRKTKKNKRLENDLKGVIQSAGGFDYAKSKIAEYSDQALMLIEPYPDSIYKQTLVDLVKYNGKRNN